MRFKVKIELWRLYIRSADLLCCAFCSSCVMLIQSKNPIFICINPSLRQ